MKNLYSKIKSCFGRMATDKVLHVLCSILVCIFVASIIVKCGMNNDAVIYLSTAFTLVVGILKEIADKIWGGDASFQDILADFIGVVIGIAFVSIIIL